MFPFNNNQAGQPNLTQNIKQQIPNEMSNLINNPLEYLARRNLNLPQNFQGGPKEIVQHLVNSGQMDQNTFNRLYSFVNRIKPLN